jgi:hypothetical protein
VTLILLLVVLLAMGAIGYFAFRPVAGADDAAAVVLDAPPAGDRPARGALPAARPASTPTDAPAGKRARGGGAFPRRIGTRFGPMILDEPQRRSLRFLAVLLAYGLLAGVVLWALWVVRRIWPPFFVAFVIAIALAPVVDRLEARRWPRWAATTTVYLGLLLGAAGVLFVLVPVVSGQIAQIVADLREKFRLGEPADLSRTMAEQIRIFGRQNQIPSFIVSPIVQQAKSSATLLTQRAGKVRASPSGSPSPA